MPKFISDSDDKRTHVERINAPGKPGVPANPRMQDEKKPPEAKKPT